MKIEVYSDGSATVATKPGGYGFVIVVDGVKHSEGSGPMENATNNDAELMAAVEGLKKVLLMRVQQPELYGQADVTLVSDSEIVLGWTNGTYRFKQKSKMAQYETLRSLAARLRLQTRWVEGHTGDIHNERCDELANIARKTQIKYASVIESVKPEAFTLAEKPDKKSRKKKETSLILDVVIEREMLDNMVHIATEFATNTRPLSSDLWWTAFKDKLKELMDISKPYSVKVRR